MSGYDIYKGRSKSNNAYKNLKKVCPICNSDNSADPSKNNNRCVNCGASLRGIPSQLVFTVGKKKH